MPALAHRFLLAQEADDPPAGSFDPNLPVAEAFAREQVPPADRTCRHRAVML